MTRLRFAAPTVLLALCTLWAVPSVFAQSIVSDTTVEDGPGSLPLEPTRTFGMIASEGSWLSVDVHPNGETLMFGLLGDLYRLPIEGGDATRARSATS